MTDVKNLVGREVQGWLLTESIGHGADGIVYKGKKDETTAAIKIFFPESLKKNGLIAARERLELQLALVGKKHHPNLVEFYGGGIDEMLGTLFLVMEIVAGTSLDKLIGNIPPSVVVPLAGQLASAAKYLETLGLVHRDIKPANIVISNDLKKLTLLDLGIVHQLPNEDDQGRLSGMEFVATLRYSPPEFVWRTEQGNDDDAWRAVTFYQIGATLHDMIMGKPLFSGYDTPRAHLYDAVRDRTPEVNSHAVDGWLIQTAQACLLKNWRDRLQFIFWDSFYEPASTVDVQQMEKKIRLRQIRYAEMHNTEEKQLSSVPIETREQKLWVLNNALAHEIRTYSHNSPIFPKCSVVERTVSQREYVTQLLFESDSSRNFSLGVSFTVTLAVSTVSDEATRLSFNAVLNEKIVSSAVWNEMFTVETAFETCQQSFLDAVDSMLSI